MRLLTLAAAALFTPLATSAAPLKGIPADVDVGMHISYDEAAKSKLHPTMQTLQKRMEKLTQEADPAGAQRNKELMERLGIKPDASHAVDIGVRVAKGKTPAADEETASPEFNVYIVARLDLRKAALDAFAKDQGVGPVVMGDISGWESSKLVGAILKVLAAEGGPSEMIESMLLEYAVVMPEDNVLILCPVRDLAKTVACWRGKSASYELPAGARTLVSGTPLAHTQGHIAMRKMQETLDPESLKTDKAGLKDLAVVMGEDAKSVLIRVNASFIDEAKAKVGAQQINATLALGNLATAEEEADDSDTKYFKGEAAVFMSGITVKQEGATVAIHGTYPIENAQKLLAKIGEKAEQTVREVAAAGQAPAATDESEEMDAPPAPKKTK